MLLTNEARYLMLGCQAALRRQHSNHLSRRNSGMHHGMHDALQRIPHAPQTHSSKLQVLPLHPLLQPHRSLGCPPPVCRCMW